MLGGYDGQRGDLRPEVLHHQPGARAVSRADIANAIALTDPGLLGDEVDESFDRFGRRLATRPPEPVMDVFPPDFAIETIEFLVVVSDHAGVQGATRLDHAGSLLGFVKSSAIRDKN